MSASCSTVFHVKALWHHQCHERTLSSPYLHNQPDSLSCSKLYLVNATLIDRRVRCSFAKKEIFVNILRFGLLSVANVSSKTNLRWSGLVQALSDDINEGKAENQGDFVTDGRKNDSSSETPLESILQDIQETINQNPYLSTNFPSTNASSLDNLLSSSVFEGVDPTTTQRASTGSENDGGSSQLGNESLQKKLLTLSQSLSQLSTTLQEVSQNVKSVAEAIGKSQQEPSDVLQMQVAKDADDEPKSFVKMDEKSVGDRTHELAFRLQRAYVQARIQGLGKPFELAMEDFVRACMEAKAKGIDLPQMQLLLILAEGSLPSQFSTTPTGNEPNPFVAEEGRVRTSWIRLVYTTLHLVNGMKRGILPSAPDALVGNGPSDPMDNFVVQTVKLALEDGYDLTRVSSEQQRQGPPTSQAIKMMRESQFLVLLTLQKASN